MAKKITAIYENELEQYPGATLPITAENIQQAQAVVINPDFKVYVANPRLHTMHGLALNNVTRGNPITIIAFGNPDNMTKILVIVDDVG